MSSTDTPPPNVPQPLEPQAEIQPVPGAELSAEQLPIDVELLHEKPTPVNEPPWGLWDVALLGALTVVLLVVSNLAALWIFTRRTGLSAEDFARNATVVLASEAFTYLLVLGYMVIFIRQRHRPFWSTVRFTWPPNWIAYPVIGIALSILVSSVSMLLPIPKSLPIEQYFADRLSAYLMALFGITFAPLMEELIFRGFLFPALLKKMHVVWAIGITSIFFAAIHASQLAHAWAPLTMLFLVSVVLTTARAKTGSVAASFLIHVGYNATLFFVMFLATDHFTHFDKAI